MRKFRRGSLRHVGTRASGVLTLAEQATEMLPPFFGTVFKAASPDSVAKITTEPNFSGSIFSDLLRNKSTSIVFPRRGRNRVCDKTQPSARQPPKYGGGNRGIWPSVSVGFPFRSPALGNRDEPANVGSRRREIRRRGHCRGRPIDRLPPRKLRCGNFATPA